MHGTWHIHQHSGQTQHMLHGQHPTSPPCDAALTVRRAHHCPCWCLPLLPLLLDCRTSHASVPGLATTATATSSSGCWRSCRVPWQPETQGQRAAAAACVWTTCQPCARWGARNFSWCGVGWGWCCSTGLELRWALCTVMVECFSRACSPVLSSWEPHA
jgi:hypothetical protein